MQNLAYCSQAGSTIAMNLQAHPGIRQGAMKAKRPPWGSFGLALLLPLLFLLPACGREDERPPTFTYVYETVLAPNCATIGCHNSFSQTYGLQFNSKEAAYTSLMGRVCDDNAQLAGQAPGNFVRPGQPDRSLLISLMLGDDVPRRMPPDRGLSSVDIALVEEWILEGAKCD